GSGCCRARRRSRPRPRTARRPPSGCAAAALRGTSQRWQAPGSAARRGPAPRGATAPPPPARAARRRGATSGAPAPRPSGLGSAPLGSVRLDRPRDLLTVLGVEHPGTDLRGYAVHRQRPELVLRVVGGTAVDRGDERVLP